MRPFVHPTRDDVTLAGVLHALADPARMGVFRTIAAQTDAPVSCKAATPDDMPRSTRTHHLRVLREAGLICSEKKGAEVLSTARLEDIEIRFPGLLAAIMRAANR